MYSPPDASPEFADEVPKNWILRPQADGELGGRLSQFFEAAFQAGAARVVALGSDAPELTAAYIRLALDQLGTVDVTLGPASDGGYNSIATKRYFPELFREIPWSSSRVFAATVNQIEKLQLSYCPLTILPDLDTFECLQAYRKRLQHSTTPADLQRWNELQELLPNLVSEKLNGPK